MSKSLENRCVSILALAAALLIPGLLPQSAHGMYDPKHGRWLQRDPIGYVDGQNLHQYALSNPAKFVDPDGTDVIGDCDCEDVIKVAGIADYKMVPAGKLVRYYTRTPKYHFGYYDSPTGELMPIVMGMLLSKHTFKLTDGKTESWYKHIRARENVVNRARSAPASAMDLVLKSDERANLTYWADNHMQSLKNGVSPAAAFLDPWESSDSAYYTGCSHWTLMILAAAWVDTEGPGTVDAAMKGLTGAGRGGGAPLLAARGLFTTTRQGDKEGSFWIPGDKGYFAVDATNNTYLGPSGEEGIHIGWHVVNVSVDYANKRFWFFAPGMGIRSREYIMDTTNKAWTNPGEWRTTIYFPKTGLDVSR